MFKKRSMAQALFSKNILLKVLQHLLFWTVYVLLSSFIFSYQSRFPYYFFLENYMVNLAAYASFTYLVIYVMVPRFLFNRKIGLFILLIIPLSVAFVFIKLLLNEFVFYQWLIPKVFHPEEWISYKLFIENIFWIWIPTAAFASVKYFREWITTMREKNELQEKQLEAELKLLKAQLHPHFLFNTLNNLYVLALEKSEKTPDVIMKISELFHYILYECNADWISLENEVELIKNYIELERLRYDENLTVEFDIQGQIAQKKVAPMLFFVFVENAFKHGCRNDIGHPYIKLSLKAKNGKVQFMAVNSLPDKKVEDKVMDGGVGLENLEKRLNLLYPNKHSLLIERGAKEFLVNLELDTDNVYNS